MNTNCVCCGTPLKNELDTFGYVRQEMCWDCYSGLFEDAAPTHYMTFSISGDRQPFITISAEQDRDSFEGGLQ